MWRELKLAHPKALRRRIINPYIVLVHPLTCVHWDISSKFIVWRKYGVE